MANVVSYNNLIDEPYTMCVYYYRYYDYYEHSNRSLLK